MRNCYLKYCFIFFLFSICAIDVNAQDSTSITGRLLRLPDKLVNSVSRKVERTQLRMQEASLKYLRRLEKQELKLQRELAQKDSTKANEIFGNVKENYAKIRQVLNQDKIAGPDKSYNGFIDSMTTSLAFLRQSGVNVDGLMSKYGLAQLELDKTNMISKIITDRQRQLEQLLSNNGYTKALSTYKKEVYYYKEQISTYQHIFEDPVKLESKVLELVKRIPAFDEFFRKNSVIGSLFNLPGQYVDYASTTNQGWQTRDLIMREMQQTFSGINVQQSLGSSVTNAQQLGDRLSERLVRFANGSGAPQNIPDFKPNDERTKTFWKRLEYGSNVQSSKSNFLFPTTTSFGISVGYKMNSKSTAGVGASYLMGWGRDFRHISLSHQGVGLRTFIDYKLKGSFWMSGGAEWNYRSRFENLSMLNDLSRWQHSALIGLTKKYQISKKVKGRMQLMYDFLHYLQKPATSPLIFRLEYGL